VCSPRRARRARSGRHGPFADGERQRRERGGCPCFVRPRDVALAPATLAFTEPRVLNQASEKRRLRGKWGRRTTAEDSDQCAGRGWGVSVSIATSQGSYTRTGRIGSQE